MLYLGIYDRRTEQNNSKNSFELYFILQFKLVNIVSKPICTTSLLKACLVRPQTSAKSFS